MSPPIEPEDEARRLEALRRYDMLDTLPEQAFDDLTALAAKICGTPIALLSLVDAERQWFKSKVGLTASETPRAQAFCAHALREPDLLVVPDASRDERFAGNPMVAGDPGIRFYAGAPLVAPDGEAIGALCVIDRVPRRLEAAQLEALGMLSRQAMSQLELRRRTVDLSRLSRLYAALGAVNRAIVTTPTRRALFRETCRVLVEAGGFHLAWIAWHDARKKQLVPVAASGEGSDYIRTLKIYSDERPEGRGPTGTAFREDRTYICNDMLADPATLPWRTDIERQGFKASAVFPVHARGRPVGTLNVYADENGFFQDKEITLLTEAAGSLSFGLDNLAREEERRRAETRVRLERGFSEAILNSLPGVLYLYDQSGRFLRWNRHFAQVTGYTDEEIRARHPLDFFAGEDKEAVAARIGEVFTKGESSIEAGFVTKDGRVIPYYFTGVMIEFEGRPCLIGVGIDVSARRQAEWARLASEVRYRTLFEQAPDGILIADRRGNYLDANAAMCRMLDFAREELIGLNAEHIVAAEETAGIEPALSAIKARNEYHREWQFRRKDGSTFPADVIATVMPDGNLLALIRDVTQRKQAEAALRLNEARLRALFEQAPLGIAVLDTASGRFREINPQYCRIVGYSGEEMLELDFQRITHPDDLARDVANMRRLQDGEVDAFHMEKRYFRKDGSIVWVSLTCVPLWNNSSGERQHIAMVEDITERKLAETRLAQSERNYRELVELANSIILRWNAEGRITFLNDYGQRFFGYAADEILGRHVVGTIVPEADEAGRNLAQLIGQISANPEAFERSVNENMRRGGERVWITWSNRILRDATRGGIEILSIGTDVTRQRQAEAALRELNENLERRVLERTAEMQAAVERAKTADQIKSAFLATMSHELRTPLNSIIGFTGIVLQGLAGPLNEEQARQLGMVRGSARHLLELINDVLDISKIEAGQLEVRAEEFDLPGTIDRVVTSVRVLAEKKGLGLGVVVAPELGGMVNDRRRLEQILLNLMNNAIKFTDRGRVTLTVDLLADYQRSPDDRAGPAVRLQVADTGIGIKAENLPKLFQPFRQIDAGLARTHEGTGLGLAICRRLATLMGGAISVASEWQRGSVFTVLLPLKRPPSP